MRITPEQNSFEANVLENKKLLNKEDINQIEFSKNNTVNELSQKNFIRSFLESIRQKMYSNRKW